MHLHALIYRARGGQLLERLGLRSSLRMKIESASIALGEFEKTAHKQRMAKVCVCVGVCGCVLCVFFFCVCLHACQSHFNTCFYFALLPSLSYVTVLISIYMHVGCISGQT